MRVLITRQLSGSIDGIQLEPFTPGYIYDVGTSLGSYLMAIEAARPVEDDSPVLVLPLGKHLFGPPPANAPARISPPVRAQAADRPRSRKNRRQ